MKRITTASILIILTLAAFFWYLLNISQDNSDQNPQDSNKQQIDSIVSVIAVGDIMLGSSYPTEEYLPKDGGIKLLQNIKSYLFNKNSKIPGLVFGNLEGVLTDIEGIRKECDDESKCYNFKMPSKSVSILKDAGFNLLSIANNHVGDFGTEAIEDEIKTLGNNSIYFAGAKQQPYTSFTIANIRIGFTAFSPNSETNDLRDIKKACELIKFLDSTNDIVIVSFHGGAEGAINNHVVKETEYFLDENRGNVYQFAHRAIDAGADLVLGHGPHVLRAIEIYHKRLIAYSLGNFATYRQINISGTSGIACILNLKLNQKGELLICKIIPTIQKQPGTPIYDNQNKALKIIRDLTNADFPEGSIILKDDGKIDF
ncbi:MAG: CapA family protein [Candidatus Kapabacteria bacterium]|nr:CapA family protein [Candidatus Kapabacteria bacterium]